MSKTIDNSDCSIDCDDISVPSADDVSQLVDVLDGVGVKRARALTLAGIDSIACLATVDPSVVAQLPSFGSETAQSVVDQACMHEQDDTMNDTNTITDSDSDSDLDVVDDSSGIPEFDTDAFEEEVYELNEVALDIYGEPLPGMESTTEERDMTPDKDCLQVAVVAHKDYGKEMPNKQATQLVLDAIQKGPIRSEEIDQVVCVHPDEVTHGGHHIFNAIHYDWNKGFTSSSMSGENIKDAMIDLNPVETPWGDVVWCRDNTSAHLSGSNVRPSADDPYDASVYDDFEDMVRQCVDTKFKDGASLEDMVNALIVMHPEFVLADIEDALDEFDITEEDERLESKITKLGEDEDTADGFLKAYDMDNRGNKTNYQELTRNGKNKNAPQIRNEFMADVADCLLVVDDGRNFTFDPDTRYSGYLDSVFDAFRDADKPVINYSDIRESEKICNAVDLPVVEDTL
jgi:hypothetical protein